MADMKTTLEKLSIGNFNSYASEFRTKIDSLVKQLLLVSGGIQTFTIGAFISTNQPEMTTDAVSRLKVGWTFLSISIITCLTLMLFIVLAQFHVIRQQQSKVELPSNEVAIFNTWPWLQRSMLFVGITAFLSCVLGVVFVSIAAITLIKGP